jgi:hypothetical protein
LHVERAVAEPDDALPQDTTGMGKHAVIGTAFRFKSTRRWLNLRGLWGPFEADRSGCSGAGKAAGTGV